MMLDFKKNIYKVIVLFFALLVGVTPLIGVRVVHAADTSWTGALVGGIFGTFTNGPAGAGVGAATGAAGGVGAGVSAATDANSGGGKNAGGCGILNIGDCVGLVVALVVAVILYVASWLASFIIAVEVWAIQIILGTTLDVVNVNIVQSGFSVVLSIANLGFVLGIIVVALATILRRETYGIKSVFWKLVAMAILVNFILVIAAPLVGFSNSLTMYFLKSFPGGGNGFAAFNGFGNALMHAFQPQQLVAPENAANAVGNLIGGTLGQTLAAIIALLLGLITLVLVVVCFAVFAFMLLVRFLYLTFLFVVAPFAWMLWIFPKTSKYMSQWWDNFIRWTFFPPIVMFFMWLVLVIGTSTPLLNPTTMKNITQVGGLPTFLQNLGTQALAPVIGTALADFVMLGLMLGGMYAANKMSITGAGAALGAAKGIGNSIKGYAAKQSQKGARAAYQKMGGQKLNERLSRSRVYGVSALGRQMSTITEKGGKDLVSAAAKDAGGKSTDRIVNEMKGRMGTEEYLAYLNELQKRGDLHRVQTVGGKTLREFMADEKTIKNYDQGKLIRDYNVATMSDGVMREAVDVLAKGGKDATMVDKDGVTGDENKGKDVRAADILNKAAEKFARTLNPNDVSKMALNQLFGAFPKPTPENPSPNLFGMDEGEIKALTVAIGQGIAAANPYLVPSMAGKINNSQNLKRFEESYRLSVFLSQKDGTISADLAKTLNEKLDNILGNKLLFGSVPEPGTAGAPPPPAAPTK